MLISRCNDTKRYHASFKLRSAFALGISLIGDLLDYITTPIFDMLLTGDVFDVILTSLLFRITRSKVSAVINAIEFIPFVRDLISPHTLYTLVWIMRELRARGKKRR
jgi:hypothetical protein